MERTGFRQLARSQLCNGSRSFARIRSAANHPPAQLGATTTSHVQAHSLPVKCGNSVMLSRSYQVPVRTCYLCVMINCENLEDLAAGWAEGGAIHRMLPDSFATMENWSERTHDKHVQPVVCTGRSRTNSIHPG
jgi:hypothetical protein